MVFGSLSSDVRTSVRFGVPPVCGQNLDRVNVFGLDCRKLTVHKGAQAARVHRNRRFGANVLEKLPNLGACNAVHTALAVDA